MSGVKSKADLAVKSSLSFPLTLMWLGIQYTWISLQLDMESSLLNSLMIRGFSSFLFPNDSKIEDESENMVYFLCLLLEMMLSARSIGWASAEKMEFSIERAFF